MRQRSERREKLAQGIFSIIPVSGKQLNAAKRKHATGLEEQKCSALKIRDSE